MRILITGINGFIGQHLGRALVKRKHQVLGLGRDKESAVKGIIAYYSGSILDKRLIEKASYHVDVVVHLAALTSHKDIVKKKFEALETNFLGTRNVLDVFSKSNQACKFLYPSTGKVYGKIVRLPISETHPTSPLNLLGKSKLITERLIDFYNDNTSTSLSASQKELIILRIFNTYGIGQNANFLIPTILAQLNLKKRKIVLGDIKAKRDYVYIDDLIRAFICAIEKKGSKGLSTYNICSDEAVSASEIVEMISRIKGVKIKIKVNSDLLRSDEAKEEYGSYRKAKRELGWESKISLEEGLRRLLI
ncbi:MAG: NAD(P)-dependent oxidoreductase [Patescibacteria group bacterium]